MTASADSVIHMARMKSFHHAKETIIGHSERYVGWSVSRVCVPRLQICAEDISNTGLGVDLTALNATQGMKDPLWSYNCGERVKNYL